MTEENKEFVPITDGIDTSVNTMKLVSGGSLIDITEFDGNKAKIATIIPQVVDSQYDEFGKLLPNGQKRKVLKLLIATEKLGEKTSTSGKTFEVRGKHYFGVKSEMKNGQPVLTGWSDKSKLAAFMSKHKVTHPKDLKGKFVVLKERSGFLDFYTE